MAKAKYISEFERDVMRIGAANGYTAPQIARFLKRGKMVVYNHIKAMEAEGTLQNLPLCFVEQEIAAAIGKAGRK
jgi:transposase